MKKISSPNLRDWVLSFNVALRLITIIAAVLTGSGVSMATTITLNFDDVVSLNEYAPIGVTFSDNASIWTHGSQSVFAVPNGGAASTPSSLQFGDAGGVLGSIFLNFEVDSISIWALSGPGPDLLNAPMYVRAFDDAGSQVGEDNINPLVQFDLLSISASGIRRLDFFSPLPHNDVWDDLTLTFDETGRPPEPVPEPNSMRLVFTGMAVLAGARLGKKK